MEKHRTGANPREPSLTRRAFVQAAVGAGAAGLVAAADEKPPAPAFVAGSDWPMYRHDPALSAVSPLRGGLAEAPRVAWSLDLGGPHVPSESVVVRDVTGDGRDEFLTLTADSVACRDNRGRLLWKLDNFLNPTIHDILDFAGDGSRGCAGPASRPCTVRRGRPPRHEWRLQSLRPPAVFPSRFARMAGRCNCGTCLKSAVAIWRRSPVRRITSTGRRLI